MEKKRKRVYQERKKQFSEELSQREKNSALISNLRLLTVLLTIAGTLYGKRMGTPFFTLLPFLMGLSLFIWLVILHHNLSDRISRLKRVIAINRKGVARLENCWDSFDDKGEEFIDEEHPHSFDLDIFGKGSLFQYITTAHTFWGRRMLAAALTTPVTKPETIYQRQKAVGELADHIDFRQYLEEAASTINSSSPSSVIEWAKNEPAPLISQKVLPFMRLLPYLSFGVFLIDTIWYKSTLLPLPFYLIQTAIFLLFYQKGIQLFTAFERQKRLLQIYAEVLHHIESHRFQSPYLNELQQKLCTNNGTPPSTALKKLTDIVQKSDLRHNYLAHFVVNIFSLWDIRCAAAAIAWKKEYGHLIELWFKTIGEMESLCSLALLSFDHPSWSMPTVDDTMEIAATDVSHPLIPVRQSVGNSILLNGKSRVAIISGSNMSGKSTFLRTLATNLLLAYAGAPVAADTFSCGTFEIVTSMRSADSVNKNVSTFYAELLRIKRMVDMVKMSRKTFFIIDEIFSGTNSRDRIEGALTVLRELHRENSLGMVSTHDLELCRLSEDRENRFENYHFREEYCNDEILFDYTISPGPSPTRNALFLMKKVGISVGDIGERY